MPWLLASPGHQHPWYWQCRTGKFLSYLGKDFNYLCHVNAEELHEMSIYIFLFPLENLARKGLSFHYDRIPWHAASDTLHYGTTLTNMKTWKATNVSLNYPLHWTGIVIILGQFSSLSALDVVIMTTRCVASDGNFINMTKFPFQMTTFNAACDEKFC